MIVVRLVVNPMRRVISETNCAVALIHHTGTDDGRMRGATALDKRLLLSPTQRP